MDDKRIYEILNDLGLSKRKADIYLFLSKKGVQKAQSIAAHLDIDRAQTYRLLRSLKEMGVLEETIEAPTRYIAVPIEDLIKSYVKDKKSEIDSLEADKDKIVSYFSSISKKEPEAPMAKFQIITGRNGIYSKISQMVKESKNEVSSLTTSLGLLQEDALGIIDMIIDSAEKKKNVKFRMLANITQDNLDTMKNIKKMLPNGDKNIEWRHTIVGSSHYPRFVVKDDEEILLYMTSKDKPAYSKYDSGLWVASKMFVSTLKASFKDIWRNSVNVNDRINELETGTPIEETFVIKNPVDTQTKIENIFDNTKNEIILITSSVGINKISESSMFKKCLQQGIKLRIMAPIDLDNLGAAKELSKHHEIRHVSINYLTMLIADGKHLFIFKSPPLEAEIDSPFYFGETFYTNDPKYLERTNGLLNDIWKRGTAISEIGSTCSMGTPVVEVTDSTIVPEIVDTMLKNNVRSVLVNKNNIIIGIIDQRDILDKVLRANKNPNTTHAHEIMSTPILTIDSDQPLIAALKTIKEKGIPRLAVMKNGKLIAMLS